MADNVYNPNSSGSQIITPGGGLPGLTGSNDISRILPRQLSTGALRGTQNVGYGGGVLIDSSNDRIVLGSSGQTGSGTVGSIILDGAKSAITVSNNINIDGVGDAITVTNTDGSKIGMGKIPNSTDFGFFSLNAAGQLIMKIVNGTWYVYRPDATNVMQSGILPDGTAGWAVASTGEQVADGFA